MINDQSNDYLQSWVARFLLQNTTKLIAAIIDTASIKIDVIAPNKAAALRLLVAFLATITNPLASAKSAIAQIKNQHMAMIDNT